MKPMRILGCLAALAAPGRLLPAAGAPEPRAITAADLWSVKRPASLRLSPDETKLVFSVREDDLEKNSSVAHLWILDTATGAERKLTSAESTDADPEWSPDGTRIAFASKRGADEVPSLYVIPVDGGEASKVLELPLPLSTPRWLPDGHHILVATEVLPRLSGDAAAMKAELKRQKESKVTAKATEDEFYRFFDTWHTDGRATHLLLVDLATRKTTDLTPRWERAFRFDREIQYDVSPDGKWVALCAGTTPPPYHGPQNLDIYLLSIEHPEAPWRNLTPDNQGPDSEPRFTRDGSAVLFGRTLKEADTAENKKLMSVDLASGLVRPLFPGLDLSLADWQPSPDGATLYFRAEDHGRTKVFASRSGAAPAVIAGEGTNLNLAVGRRALYFLRENFSRPDEVYGLNLASGSASVRSHLNDGLFAQLKLGKVEERTYSGADGDPIELWLAYPPDFDPAKKYPLLVLMHGGPHTMIGDMWQPRWNIQVFAAPGYVATWMNRHGSTGFGEKFSSIQGAWGEKPFEDIMKGTDYLLDTFPFLDRTRTAALGASYGGYMACWVCGHTDRFKAIVCHAGALDFTTQFASDVAPYWQPYAMDGAPWNRTAAYDRENAINYASHFKTPTLVTHGGMDYRVPVDQGLEFYAALQAQNVPSRLVYFPDENHWILHAQNSVYWYGEVRDWLARWLK
jgi:dipeptidyl aminopeptidase/acylaminoacyl peptidase